MKRIASALLAVLALTASLHAQVAPYIYAPTIGTSSSQVLSQNPLRKRLIFVNPNATANVAVCPIGPTRTGATITPAINGAGCITILPLGSFTVDGAIGSGPLLSMPSAWNAIASAGSSALTILEFE